MIVRIADDGAAAERMPWVTLGLMAVFVATFLLARGSQPVSSGGEVVELEHAVGYWLEHPYLDAKSEIADAAAEAAGDADVERFVERARARGPLPPMDLEALEQEQSGLAYMTALALRGTDARPGPAHPFHRFGLIANAPRVHALFTHPFLHAGFVHLLSLLLLLWLVGPVLERRLGLPVFGALLLGGLLAGALARLAGSSSSLEPFIGASGIAAAALGAFLARFGTGPMRISYYTLRDMRPTMLAFDTRAWALAPIALLLQVTLSFAFMNSEVAAGNDWFANGIALAAGAALALAAQRLDLERRFATRAEQARVLAKLDPRLKRALTARERSKHDEAIELAESVLRERPDDADALKISWDAHVAAGRAGDGARSARRLVELHARHGDLARAARIWEELVRVAHKSRVAPTTLLRIVPELVVQARRDAAIAALRAVFDPANPGLTVGQALRVAELGTELDPPTALLAARYALESGELVEERRARLEQLVLTLENAGVRTKSLSESGFVIRPTPPATAPSTAATPAPIAAKLDPDTAVDEALAELSLPDEASERGPAPTPESAELFEIEPTQLGVEAPAKASELPETVYKRLPELDEPTAPVLEPPVAIAVAPAPAARPDENFQTVLYSAPPENRASFASVKVTPAIPVALDIPGLRVRLEGGAPSLIEWTRIQAVGVGLVSGLGPKPMVVIDLALNWADAPDGELEVMRLRSDGFRARQLVTGAENALDALRALLAELLARSGAVPLPDASGAHGLPFREFPTPAAYQTEVLLAEA
jgi:membrane associated rhomboid family serine protease